MTRRIRFTEDWHKYAKGTIVDMDNTTAESLIRFNVAEEVDRPPEGSTADKMVKRSKTK